MAAWSVAALGVAAGPVSAQDSMPGMAEMEHKPVDCRLVRMALPPELAGWSDRTALAAAKNKGGLKKAGLTVGKAVDAGLVQTSDVRYVLRPEKPGGSVSYGGMFGFAIREAGTYRVALGSGAWIDLIKDGKAVESSNHGHGPDCTGVRKMVDFPLTPGRYVLQLAANGGATLPVMVAKLP